MKIIVLGKNGMLGTYVSKYLLKKYDVYGVTRNDIDFSQTDTVKTKLTQLHTLNESDLVINCVGTIKPRCDELGDINAIKINSIVPRILLEDSKEKGYKLLHPTTDCIYTGNTGYYTESSTMDVTDVYGVTKYLGETSDATNLRVSIIGEEVHNKRSLVEWCKSLNGKTASGFTDHLWNGVTCLQYAKILDKMIEGNIWWKGTRHVLSPRALTKYELVKYITDAYNVDVQLTATESKKPCNRTLSTEYHENNLFEIPELQVQIQEMKEFSSELYSS
jgi:dTDP-4-dehydrorhamnose reductase